MGGRPSNFHRMVRNIRNQEKKDREFSALEAELRTLRADKVAFVERVLDRAYSELRRRDERITKRVWRELRRAAIDAAREEKT